MRGDVTGDVIDGGKNRIAVFLGGCADANEDRFAAAYGFTGVRGVRNFAGTSRRFEDFVQVMLVDRHASRLKLRDPLLINVRANDIMPRFGETCAGHQADVTTSDYRETQGIPPGCDSSIVTHVPV